MTKKNAPADPNFGHNPNAEDTCTECGADLEYARFAQWECANPLPKPDELSPEALADFDAANAPVEDQTEA